jgi:single-strand DNA-binding protein
VPNFASITLIGHLGRDAEVKFLANGTPVTRLTLAVTTGIGEKKITTWYKASAFGDRYQKIAQYLTKGRPVTIVGEPCAREWKSDSGVSHTDIEVRVNDVVLLGNIDKEVRQSGTTTQTAAPAAEPHDESIPF